MNLKKIALIDTLNTRLLSIGNFDLNVDSTNLKTDYHKLKSIRCDDFYVIFESYDKGDNWTRLMNIAQTSADGTVDTTDYSNPFIILSNYIAELGRSYLTSTYRADSVVVRNAEFQYNDYTLPDRFSFNMDRLNMTTGEINTDNHRINIFFDSRLNKAGYTDAKLSINPKDYQDLDLKYNLSKFPFSSFNPYMLYYVAYPFNEGDLYYKGECSISNGILKSQNLVSLKKPVVGKKVKNTTAYKVPLKFAVALLKDVKGNIDIDLPIEGNLKDPKYKIGKVVWHVLENLMMKAVTAPINLIARLGGGKEEDIKEVRFDYLSNSFTQKHSKTIGDIADALSKKPELKVIFQQHLDLANEREMLAVHLAKMKYLISKQILSELDSTYSTKVKSMVDSITAKDSLFINYLDGKLNTASLAMSKQEKCKQLIGAKNVESEHLALISKREEEIKKLLIINKYPQASFTFKPYDGNLTEQQSPSFTYEVKVDEESETSTVPEK
jgi:hypothetical protein